MIDLCDITVVRNREKVFENLNLTLLPDENCVVRGSNGSGKTTLLKVIAGQILPQGGQVRYHFIDPALDWDIQYDLRKKAVHEIPAHALHELTGVQKLYYQQRYYSIGNGTFPRVSDYFGARLGRLRDFDFPPSLRITDLLDLELTRLSNGQIKKIIIISKLLDNIPKLLLLDYPFDGLDAASRSALCELLDHLSQVYKIQVILTDHMHALPKCVTHGLNLNDGKITKTNYRASSVQLPKEEPRQPERANDTTAAVVEMKDVTIRYGNKVIIEDLSWRINRGERWALTGKNGSGKTTIFSLIYADHPMAYSQQVYLFGKRRGTGESIWDIKSRMNYLGPEQIHFLDIPYPTVIARDYIGEQKATSENELQSLISFFNAGRLMQKQVRHLSGGELQLVLLIIFFLSKKELLLLDEPFQFLDPGQRQRVSEYLNHYLDDSVTLVMITHDECDIEKWTNHRLHLSNP